MTPCSCCHSCMKLASCPVWSPQALPRGQPGVLPQLPQASPFLGSAGTCPTSDTCLQKTRHTLLSQGYPVVLQEDDLELVPHIGVIVDDLTNGCDEFDDHLGHVVAGGCLKKSSPEMRKAFKEGRA